MSETDLFHNGTRYVAAEAFASTDYRLPGLMVQTKEYRPGAIQIGANWYSDPMADLTARVEKLTFDLNAASLRVEDLMRRIVNMEATYEHTITQANQERDQWMVLVEDLRDIQ